MDKILSCNNLTKTYGKDGSFYALKNVSMHINKSELLVIVGTSGSGKSTLLNLLSGIDKCSSGAIYFNNKDITKFNEKKMNDYLKNNIGFVYQSYNLINELTVYENILLTCSNKKEIDTLLKKMNLLDKKNAYPKNLSGGEQQRVAIARALSKNFDVLFCDEPTGALDSKNSEHVLSILEQLVRKEGKTIIIVTHNNDICKIADRIYTMKNGQIIDEKVNKTPVAVKEIRW